MVDFNNITSFREYGLTGFHGIQHLYGNLDVIPKEKGIYFVLYDHNDQPEFLSAGTGGHFKGRNPNVTIEKLNENWVDDTKVMYIGKAGGETGRATLQSRLKQYLKFGQGIPVGHWGGRLIWQIKNSGSLTICWKPLPDNDPREIEKNLIQDFLLQYGNRPFANLTG
jgi:hypothetical protein